MVPALITLGFIALGTLPGIIVLLFILRKFYDPAVSRKSLFIQFLLGAIPLAVAIIIIQGVLSALIMFIFYSDRLMNEIDSDSAEAAEVQTAARFIASLLPLVRHHSVNTSNGVSLFQTFRKPLWKLILATLLIVFVTSSAVEEIGKWILARRYRNLNDKDDDLQSQTRIGCKGILAIISIGALGFAFFENVLYAGLISTAEQDLLLRLGIVFLRGSIAFTLHVSTQFYVGVAAASQYVFRDHANIALSLFISILFHGTFNAFELITIPFATEADVPTYISFITLGLQIGSVCLLLLLCRGRYKALLDRERMVATAAVDEEFA